MDKTEKELFKEGFYVHKSDKEKIVFINSGLRHVKKSQNFFTTNSDELKRDYEHIPYPKTYCKKNKDSGTEFIEKTLNELDTSGLVKFAREPPYDH